MVSDGVGMAHIVRTIFLVICITASGNVVLGSGLPSAGSSPSGVQRSSSRTIESRVRMATPPVQTGSDVEPLTEQEQALVDWATERFTQAGLELPELTVRFDPSRDLCGDAEGRYHHAPDGTKVVTICTRDGESFAAQLDRRRTLLHEFGHAWDFANMSTRDRGVLGQILGADAWQDRDDVWADRGIERFAESFVFALLDQPLRQVLVDLDCTTLLAAFSTATGAKPVGPGLPYCAA